MRGIINKKMKAKKKQNKTKNKKIIRIRILWVNWNDYGEEISSNANYCLF